MGVGIRTVANRMETGVVVILENNEIMVVMETITITVAGKVAVRTRAMITTIMAVIIIIDVQVAHSVINDEVVITIMAMEIITMNK